MKSRLRKNIIADEAPSATPFGIVFPDFQDKIVDKDKVKDITYGPSISREWLSDEPIDNPEWALRQETGKNS